MAAPSLGVRLDTASYAHEFTARTVRESGAAVIYISLTHENKKSRRVGGDCRSHRSRGQASRARTGTSSHKSTRSASSIGALASRERRRCDRARRRQPPSHLCDPQEASVLAQLATCSVERDLHSDAPKQ
jgi:hypothetical protein